MSQKERHDADTGDAMGGPRPLAEAPFLGRALVTQPQKIDHEIQHEKPRSHGQRENEALDELCNDHDERILTSRIKLLP
jgi:hypothetical protein